VELFEGMPLQRINVQLLDRPPLPRCWFLNSSGTQLIQVQPDRFVHNWRRTTINEVYPRFPDILSRFIDELNEFMTFLQKESLGQLVPRQCEVTYVNHLRVEQGWNNLGEVNKLLSIWSGTYSDEFLKTPEDVAMRIRYRIQDDAGSSIGRLHITFEPAFDNRTSEPLAVLGLTARGKPLGPDLEGIKKFLQLGRMQIVRSFTSITTREMHNLWQRES
jgi:uncharacterized protein (TIGR04255 family)